ncbi:putative sec63 protein [Lyophyllum shimeji]|uniref:Sec63 protein n=1 Tax=Lyophyllum shimeji TaxID=47721 RepID=A0A9P3PDD0_LYOSH|nr:putative sec63 protein [Lyophyllum shimeji]
MAQYNYDESGNMSAYFLITFLALVLVPTTFLSMKPSRKSVDGCQCKPCIDQRKRVRSASSIFSKKTCFLVVGWSILGYFSYRVANAKLDNKIYDPFEILGLRAGVAEKEIKSHYKKLSKLYHPDKVKATANMTVEAIQNRFVEITKAYKSLTDETIRENLEKYGHPDGRQDITMGLALPKWIVESQNNIWVLGLYGLLFGGALPALVGRWWFGSRQKTKDGVNARSAAAFFKTLKEESTFDEVLGTFSKAYQWELSAKKAKVVPELDELEEQIAEKAGSKWKEVKRLCGEDAPRRKALILLYAHLLRLPIRSSTLQSDQTEILLQTPLLLSALLNISMSRNWLAPTLSVMRLHAYLTQALLPGPERQRFAQLPGIKIDDVSTLASQATDISDVVHALEQQQDSRVVDVKKALAKWGRAEIADAAFKVIGERVVTPSSIVFLVVKLRITPPPYKPVEAKELDADEIKRRIKFNDEKDDEFLTSRKEAEDLASDDVLPGWAHAPYWPGERKPSWWVVLADEKSNRVVVPPMRVTDIPLAQSGRERDYRSYKIQFQAPQNVGVFTWKVLLVSDTFVGEDSSRDITLRIEDVSTLPADEPSEDEISDPEEDTIAGQMAAMRGGAVKKSKGVEEESDDESSTDDDESSDSTSDSDSD